MIVEVLLIVLIVVAVFLLIKNLEWKLRFEAKVRSYIEAKEREIREDAIKRSSRILSGKALERLIPFLKRFGHEPHDVRWIGDPIDLIVFDGYSEGAPEKITFVEVKLGNSKLKERQKLIKELVRKGKVKWEEFRI